MSADLQLDYANLLELIQEEEIFDLQPEMDKCHEMLTQHTGPGSDFLGWVDLPGRITKKEIEDICSTITALQDKTDTLLIIGIGGSYLGARAVSEALDPADGMEIHYAGHHLDGAYHQNLLKKLEGKKFAINVISKSGATTEPAVAFRLFRELLEKNVGREEARQLIVATTDKEKGALRSLADSEGYKTFVIPDDVGGRYSVLTPVGLVPIAAAGGDISQLVKGAVEGQKAAKGSSSIKNNPVCFYAAARNLLYWKGRKVEILSDFSPSLAYFGEWWKQLYGESEGKQLRGILPVTCHFTTDLHSMGQYIQEGERNLFETFLKIDNPHQGVPIPDEPDDLDGLNFLQGKDMEYVNSQALEGTALAHLQGGAPNMTLRLARRDATCLGRLIYFFEFACGLSGYLLGVNPFDQPGVEAYKKNMFALIDKPGFEGRKKEIEEKLNSRGEGKIIA